MSSFLHQARQRASLSMILRDRISYIRSVPFSRVTRNAMTTWRSTGERKESEPWNHALNVEVAHGPHRDEVTVLEAKRAIIIFFLLNIFEFIDPFFDRNYYNYNFLLYIFYCIYFVEKKNVKKIQDFYRRVVIPFPFPFSLRFYDRDMADDVLMREQ